MIHIIDDSDRSVDSQNQKYFLSDVRKIFAKDGYLEDALGFEFRPEQGEMAEAYANSLITGKHLIFEAGTGVGKSLAYLIPSILYSKLTKRKCLVATNTINLQEQLLDKDIPAIRNLFVRSKGLESSADFNCALLVGRANYLCQNRLNKALLGQADIFESSQRDELQRIAEWAQSGPNEGIRQEILPAPNPIVWDLVNADSSVCSSKHCCPSDCFYRKARSLVENADLIIVNHSLLFSFIGAGFGPNDEGKGILFTDDFLVFDEAHEITDVASEHLGISLSSWSLETLLRQLYNPKKGKGLLSKIARPSDLSILEQANTAIEDFFQYIHLEVLGERDQFRLTSAEILPREIFPPMSRLLRSLIELSEMVRDEHLRIELRDQIKRVHNYLNNLSELTELKDKNSVYWLERGGRKNQIIYLRSSPLEIAPLLREELFSKNSSILMTSATLSRKGNAQFFRNQIGATDADESIVSSPFDYENQMRIKICNDCPEPLTTNRSEYLNYITKAIDGVARMIEEGTLVLFTNYSDLRYCHEQLKPAWQRLQRSIYAQGTQYSRSELRRRVTEEGDALLLGAESFWKGFDAKGSCISQVIITRLPFENPSHPLLQAKSELLQAENRSSFNEITLPAAIMRFRQGVGRLIRSKTDVGELVILDSRILKKSYGKDFIAELPTKNFEPTCLLDLIGC